MKKNINLTFHIHQPYRLKRYRFFDIGNDHYYYDDFRNEDVFRQISDVSYRPALTMLGEMLEKNQDFCFALSISGLALEQMEYYSPDLIDRLRSLVETGRVEILAETYAHSLSSLYDLKEWESEILLHKYKVHQLFNVETKVLCNTELIFNDEMAMKAQGMGFKAMITEGAKHILGWKSPNYVYRSAKAKKLNLLLRSSRLSDAIEINFSRYHHPDYPITADKFIEWVSNTPQDEIVHNVILPLDVLGNIHSKGTGVFDFFRALPVVASASDIGFITPTLEADLPAIADITVVYPISRIGEEKDVSVWLGNELQQSVRDVLALWGERVRLADDRRIIQDWLYLQASDHLFYMSTRRGGAAGFSPYESPYDAFNNYMNVLSDFLLRIEGIFPSSIENEELSALVATIQNQDKLIEKLKSKLDKVNSK